MRRLKPKIMASARRWRNPRPLIISIDPDWKNDFGHFGAWDTRLERQCHTGAYEFVSLCHQELEAPPHFALRSFSQGFPSSEMAQLDQFEAELRDALGTVAPDRRSVACMYAGSLHILALLCNVSADFPHISFAINLMRSHALLDRSDVAATPDQDAAIAATLHSGRRLGIRVAVDSLALRQTVAQNFGFDAEVWPMMSTTPDDLLEPRAVGPGDGSAVKIVAPIQPQLVKGYDLIGVLAQHLRPLLDDGQARLTARHREGMPTMVDRVASTIEANGGELISGDLSIAGYASLISSADVVVVPYRRSVFDTRTSGVVLDAITANVPVITTDGTWGGRLLESFDVGRTFTDGNGASLANTVDRVIENLDHERTRLASARPAVIDAFAPYRLLQFLTDDHPAVAPLVGSEERVALRTNLVRLTQL